MIKVIKELTFEELHHHLLEIAKAFDAVCRKNNIPYYMLGGTMLGAIRHKGFIPWDDDMDFGVPRKYFDTLIEIFERDLPSKYKCRTIYNSRNITLPFYKIEDTTTKCQNNQYYGKIQDFFGLNIDIFPLDSCDPHNHDVKNLLWLVDKYAGIYTRAANDSKKKEFIKRIIRFFIPFSKKTIYNYIERKAHALSPGNYLGNLYGRWKEKEIIPTEWYGNNSYYSFEDSYFQGFVEYDKYLTRLYESYMELPPEEKRTTHSGKVVKIERQEK